MITRYVNYSDAITCNFQRILDSSGLWKLAREKLDLCEPLSGGPKTGVGSIFGYM